MVIAIGVSGSPQLKPESVASFSDIVRLEEVSAVPAAGSVVGYRDEVHEFFEWPKQFDKRRFNTSCGPARLVSYMTVVVILLSQVVICVESLPTHYQDAQNDLHPWFGLEIGVVTWFTLEYLIRLWAAPDRLVFVRSFLNVCDLLAVVPFYVEVILSTQIDFNFKVIRLLRVVRILKVSWALKGIVTIARSLQETQGQLLMAFVLLLVNLVICSTALFYMEREFSHWNEERQCWEVTKEELVVRKENGTVFYSIVEFREKSPYQSIMHTFWWGIVTLTTVGYGDNTPNTPGGRVVAAITMVLGIFLLALPSSIMGSKFLEIYKMADRKYELEKQRALQEKKDEDMTELLLLIDDLVAEGKLTATTVIYDPVAHQHITKPGEAEEVQCAAFLETYYPRVHNIYTAAKRSANPETMKRRFVRNITEFIGHRKYFDATASLAPDISDAGKGELSQRASLLRTLQRYPESELGNTIRLARNGGSLRTDGGGSRVGNGRTHLL
eukprot:Sspe_Gene.81011::Locus_51532_Transcript_1_2_Confidence_0.667_Length_1598::g.81011::m.81011